MNRIVNYSILGACLLLAGSLVIASGEKLGAEKKDEGWVTLFNGKNFDNWNIMGSKEGWIVVDGVIQTKRGNGWLRSEKIYKDFEFELEFKMPEGGNSGVFVRAPIKGNPAWAGFEIQLLDDYSDKYKTLKEYQYCGGLYGLIGAQKRVTKKAGEWQRIRVRFQGMNVKTVLNGHTLYEKDISEFIGEPHKKEKQNKGLLRKDGHVGLQNHGEINVHFRNVRIREL